MKILLFVVMFVPSLIMAQLPTANPQLQIGGVTEFLGDMLKQSRGATLLNGRGDIGGGVYVPIWTFHDMDKVNYVHFGCGGRIMEGGDYAPMGIVALNLPALSYRLWNFAWAKDHVERLKTPDIWFGPYTEIPLPGQTWVVGQRVGAMVSIGLGGKS